MPKEVGSSATESIRQSQRRLFHSGLRAWVEVFNTMNARLLGALGIPNEKVQKTQSLKLNPGDYLLGENEDVTEILEKFKDPAILNIYMQNTHPQYQSIQEAIRQRSDIGCTSVHHGGLGKYTIKIWREKSPLQK